MASINKTALAEHASAVLGSPASMSEPFSAGQYWCCFELVAPDDRLLVARVRLPKHPESNATDADEEYLIQCEVATMEFLRGSVRTVPLPRLHAYEAPGSARAISAGATYMLIEGFYGNSLQDIDHSIYNLPVGFTLLDLVGIALTPWRSRPKSMFLHSGRRFRRSLPLLPFHRSAPSRSFPQTLVLSLAQSPHLRSTVFRLPAHSIPDGTISLPWRKVLSPMHSKGSVPARRTASLPLSALSSFEISCATRRFSRAAEGRFTSTTWTWACRTFSSMTTLISSP